MTQWKDSKYPPAVERYAKLKAKHPKLTCKQFCKDNGLSAKSFTTFYAKFKRGEDMSTKKNKRVRSYSVGPKLDKVFQFDEESQREIEQAKSVNGEARGPKYWDKIISDEIKNAL